MKLIKILVISLFIISIFSLNIFAIGDIFDEADSWETTGRAHTNTTMDTNNLADKAGEIYNLLLAIATAVAMIVGAIIGVQFMTAGINKKVEVKQTLYPYLISCIVVFGSMGIWKLVVTTMSNV